mmetsp:Transcript_20991/g.37391  ORF Transcript_20991/g.37391 Transcript_20991/m.37391 type:complete len:84 (+) Transcript_20991:70-321(+)
MSITTCIQFSNCCLCIDLMMAIRTQYTINIFNIVSNKVQRSTVQQQPTTINNFFGEPKAQGIRDDIDDNPANGEAKHGEDADA